MSNPLNDLLQQSGLLSSEPTQSASETTKIKQVVTTESGSKTKTTISYQSIRAIRSRGYTNIPDTEIAGIIEAAIKDYPKIHELDGDQLLRQICYFEEVVRIHKTILYDRIRVAIHAGAPIESTKEEIEGYKQKILEQRAAKVEKEKDKSLRVKKSEKRKETKAALPLAERLMKSNEPSDRAAGKFIKNATASNKMITELGAVAMWNSMIPDVSKHIKIVGRD